MVFRRLSDALQSTSALIVSRNVCAYCSRPIREAVRRCPNSVPKLGQMLTTTASPRWRWLRVKAIRRSQFRFVADPTGQPHCHYATSSQCQSNKFSTVRAKVA
jgi:hypothetical protein